MAGSGGGMHVVEGNCTDRQSRCRDACFSTVGEVKNGCELIATKMYGLTGLTLGDGVLYAVDNEDYVMAIDTTDLTVTQLSTTARFKGYATLTYSEGWLYGYGWTDPDGEFGTYRLSISDGTFERVSPDHGPLYFSGEHIYLLATDERDNVQRLDRAGGASEIVFEGSVDSLVISGDHYYYHRGFSDFAFFSSPISDPTMETELSLGGGGVGFEAISGDVFAHPSAPEHVYLVGESLARVAVATGVVELVSEEPLLIGGVPGPEYFVFARRSEYPDPGIFALSYDGETKVALEPNGSMHNGLASDESYFYFARGDGVFRIALP
jgi:hypothetical protein